MCPFGSRDPAAELRRVQSDDGGIRDTQNDTRVERRILTVLAECLYLEVFASSEQRRRSLIRFVPWCNEARPHLGIGGRTPRQRLNEKLAA